MKHVSLIAWCAAITTMLLPLAAGAQTPTDYLLVDDLPFIGNTTDLTSYLQNIFKLGMGLAVTLAILMIVVNGIKYMLTDILPEKIAAKDIIKNAVIGLLIIFGSVTILSTINPELTKFNLSETIQRTVDAVKKGQSTRPPPPPGDPVGQEWQSDASERQRLADAGISINNANCSRVGQTGCTSVTGLSQSAIAKLINLKQACKCTLVITGGTEYWLHKTHGNKSTVDLRAAQSLDSYVGGRGAACNDRKTKDGITFVWEDNTCSWRPFPHWHVPL